MVKDIQVGEEKREAMGKLCKSLTPAEPGTRKGEKKGIGVPLEWD